MALLLGITGGELVGAKREALERELGRLVLLSAQPRKIDNAQGKLGPVITTELVIDVRKLKIA